MRYLVLHDVDAIQAYIFATDRLQEIQGASALLDDLNRNKTQELVGNQHNLIYANGGSAAAVFDDPSEADQFCQQLTDLYPRATRTATSTGVVQEYDESNPQGFQEALGKAHQELRRRKVSRQRQTQVLTSPFFQRCQSCGIYPAVRLSEHEPVELACDSCVGKRDYRNKRQTRIHDCLSWRIRRQYGRSVDSPKDLDEIGRASKPEGYIGVIYADGNRMGDYLLRIKNPKALKQFSDLVDQSVTQAITETLFNHFEDSLTEQGWRFHSIVPLCGGDDLVAIVPGSDAFSVALAYLEKFQQRVGEKLSQGLPDLAIMLETTQLSVCAGVVIAKAHTPLSRLLDLAQELCREAKRRSYLERLTTKTETPCLDFQVITAPNWAELGQVRSGPQYQLSDGSRSRLTACPYTVSEAKALVNAAQALKRSNFPPGKLHDPYRSLRLGKAQSQLEYLTMYVRARERGDYSQKKALCDAEDYLGVTHLEAPWKNNPYESRKATTPYGDLVEIYGFIPAHDR